MSIPEHHQAMTLIAACDHPGADAQDREVVRLARTWLSIMRSRHAIQGIVNRIVEEINDVPVDSGSCAWEALRKQFMAWAVREAWLEPDGSIPKRRRKRRA